jgi:hypothetical protein
MKKLKVYLASRHEDRPDIIKVRKELIKRGIHVTSRWLLEGGVLKTNVVENEREGSLHVQTNDIEDINESDIVIVFSPKKAFRNSTGGRHVEFGYTLGLIHSGSPKTLILVGYRENVFHWNPRVICARTHEDLYMYLDVFKEGRKYASKFKKPTYKKYIVKSK